MHYAIRIIILLLLSSFLSCGNPSSEAATNVAPPIAAR
jgi:hypothetical protein